MFKKPKHQAAVNDEDELYNESGATKEEEPDKAEKDKLGDEDEDEDELGADKEEKEEKDDLSDEEEY